MPTELYFLLTFRPRIRGGVRIAGSTEPCFKLTYWMWCFFLFIRNPVCHDRTERGFGGEKTPPKKTTFTFAGVVQWFCWALVCRLLWSCWVQPEEVLWIVLNSLGVLVWLWDCCVTTVGLMCYNKTKVEPMDSRVVGGEWLEAFSLKSTMCLWRCLD